MISGRSPTWVGTPQTIQPPAIPPRSAYRGSLIRDVTSVTTTMRDGAPDILIAIIQAVFIIVAFFIVELLLGACAVVGLASLAVANRAGNP